MSQEVAGIRETLELSDDDDCMFPSAPSPPNGQFESVQSSSDLLFGHGPHPVTADLLEPLPEEIRQNLLDLYRDRVDCIFKGTFWPAAFNAIGQLYNDQDDVPYSSSIRALEFSLYFMAICTLNQDECQSIMGEDKPKLLRKYRTAVEIAMSRAQLLQNPDKLVLQSFIIYLLGLRTCMQYSTCWTLLATAVRVANAIGLPNKLYTGRTEIGDELKLRMWYCIGMLDTMTSYDRGLPPITTIDDFHRVPLNVNDTDMSGYVAPTIPSTGFTSMSFFYVIQESVRCSRSLLAVRSAGDGSWTDWDEKLRLVADFEERMRQHCDQIQHIPYPFARYVQYYAQDVLLNFKLVLRRPPYRTKTSPAPPWDNLDLMQCTTEILELDLKLATDKEVAPWAWLPRSWIKWYALAVLLAELCEPRCSELTERAYSVAKDAFNRYNPLIIDTDLKSVWKPVSKLMRRVEDFRIAKMQIHSEPQGMPQQPPSDMQYISNGTTNGHNTSSAGTNLSALTIDDSSNSPWGRSFEGPMFSVLTHNDPIWQSNTDELSATDNTSWLNWDNFLGDVSGSWDLHAVI